MATATRRQEEIYLVLSGRLEFKLGDEVRESAR